MSEEKPIDHGEVVEHAGWRISWAWVFPVLAVAATAWLFWSNWRSNGPEIEVAFASAPGIAAGKTPLYFRGVHAGLVTDVRLDRDLDTVVVKVRLKEFAADLARAGTEFWIDQPVVSLGETTGLDALIQGNSLQARAGTGAPTLRFQGLDRVPLTPLESPALVLKLRARSIPFVDHGSPLYYRGVKVGVVEEKLLDASGDPVLRVVVEQEFAGTVRTNSHFWPISGTSLRVGPGGVQLDVLGLKSLLLGGLEFDHFGPPGEPVEDEAEFVLSPDRATAKVSGSRIHITFQDAQGIREGETEVRHLGIPVGVVESVTLDHSNRTVDAVVRFQSEFDHLHPDGTVFSLVQPHIGLTGISGLETLVGGVYIDCSPGEGSGAATKFVGRTLSDEDLKTARSEAEGLHLLLQADTLPAVAEGAPVYFRGIVVGRVLGKTVDAEKRPGLKVVIRRDDVALITDKARFWVVPGASIEAGPGLIDIDVAGLESLVQGGLSFDHFGAAGAAVETGAVFPLFRTESLARANSPPVRIEFANGQGLFAGRTELRYLGLPVGLVESVRPTQGRVEAVVRFYEGFHDLPREGSAFSIVRLKVSLKGVEGVETVVSGIYIECVPAAEGKLVDHFTGVSMDEAEFVEVEKTGLEVVVKAAQTEVGVEAPVSYRGVEVGSVRRKILAKDGRSAGLVVVINPPYDRLIRENTLFWDPAGLSVKIGFIDMKIKSPRLEALGRGGLSFATPDDPGAPVANGHTFELQATPPKGWQKWEPDLLPEGK